MNILMETYIPAKSKNIAWSCYDEYKFCTAWEKFRSVLEFSAQIEIKYWFRTNLKLTNSWLIEALGK